jgi:hypothetical protein
VRIAWDRDPAHPLKAQATRQRMRQLRLHWTSMPKASPDENPVETIFSDIQQNIWTTATIPTHARPNVGSAAIYGREIADRIGSFALATWRILTNIRWQICTRIL